MYTYQTTFLESFIQFRAHSKPTMNINSQHHNLLGNQISPKSEDFCIWRPFCTLVTMATAAILNFFHFLSLKIMCTHIRQHFWKVSSNFEHHSKPTMNINSQHHIYLETRFRPNRRIFVFWRPFWIQNGRHRKPMMDINYSQHHNLLGNQISPKSEDFCILDSKWPPKQTNDEYQFATS